MLLVFFNVLPLPQPKVATNESYDLLGHALPPDTVIVAQTWTMYHDADLFLSPNTFTPDQWLKPWTHKEHLVQMCMHFRTGSRVCGGYKLTNERTMNTMKDGEVWTKVIGEADGEESLQWQRQQ